MIRFQLLQAQEETAWFDEEVSILKEKLGNTKAQLRNAQAQIKRQLEENGELKSRKFCIFNLSGDESISFYTWIVMTRVSLVIQYLRFQLFREKLYCPLRMLCRCLPWMILPCMILPLDACSSSVKILQTAAVSFVVKCVMQISKELRWCTSTLIFFPPRPFSISLSRKCSEQTFVLSVSLNFVPTSLRIFYSHFIFRKIEEADSLSVGISLQRGTQQLIFELELIPNEISSQETVALKKSLFGDR